MPAAKKHLFMGISALFVVGIFVILSSPSSPVLIKQKEVKPEKSPEVLPTPSPVLPETSNKINSDSKKKIEDLRASPVFSGLSILGGQGNDKNLPELIHVDYKPIEINPGMNYVQEADSLIAMTLQRQIVCTNWEMFGRDSDGGWPVCKAKAIAPTKPCLVYSYGIRNDWTFDDAYRDAYGCTIRTFDPSMNTKEHEHSPNVMFYPLGLSDKNEVSAQGWKLDSFLGHLKQFKEENVTIPYLKFDVENYEWRVLENMVNDGILAKVVQLSFEIHVDNPNKKAGRYFQILKKVEGLGFRRWFYHHRLNGYSYQNDQSFININYLK